MYSCTHHVYVLVLAFPHGLAMVTSVTSPRDVSSRSIVYPFKRVKTYALPTSR